MQSRAKGSLELPFGVLGLLLAAALLAGCADAAVQSLQEDLAQLRQDLNSLTLTMHRSRGDTETVLGLLERRTREQAGEQQRQVAALSARIDTLGADLAQLSARLDELAQRLDAVTRQRSQPAPPAAAIPSPAPAQASPAPPAQPSAPTPAPQRQSGGPTPEETYQAAYLDFTKGHYPLAISGFREFLRRFPDAPQADAAQYWIGESYFSLARASASAGQAEQALRQAVAEFQKVITNYPRGSKVPTALYKEALALLELKQPALARQRLQYLVEHFPQSEEAPLAKDRLAQMKE
jgi:tol-pal system protein YbgF